MTLFKISNNGVPSIAWPVLSTQWHWRPAEMITLRDGAITAAEGHLWSRLVIFGHVVFRQRASFQNRSPTSQQHDIFQNFKNLSSCLPSKARTNAKLLANVRRRRRVASCRLLPAPQSPAGHTRTRRSKNRRRRVRSTAQLSSKFSKVVVFGCLRLRLVVSGRLQKSRIQQPGSRPHKSITPALRPLYTLHFELCTSQGPPVQAQKLSKS